MSKTLSALTHRSDHTREQAQAYYEEGHAPLGARLLPFTGYVRNHLLDRPDLGVDTISEFWADRMSAVLEVMSGPAGETLRADEGTFLDSARITNVAVTEQLLSPGEPTDADGRRTAYLIDSTPTGDFGEAERAATVQWAQTVADQHPGVRLDLARDPQDSNFPAAAVLWVPGDITAPEPAGPLVVQRVLVRRCETPPGELAGNRAR